MKKTARVVNENGVLMAEVLREEACAHWGSSNLSEIFMQSSRTETESKARRIFLRAFDLCLGGDYAAIAPIRASSCALLQALSGWKLLPETAPICFAQSAGCA